MAGTRADRALAEMTDPALVAKAEQSRVDARDAELEVGRVRGRITEFRTQIDRAEQDVALGWRYWITRHVRERAPRRRRSAAVGGHLISVITPVYQTEEAHLEACLASVAGQTHANWEHVLVDDGSSNARVAEILASAARQDERVRVFKHDRNCGIVAASTTALHEARGEYVAMLDHDDVLAPNALARLANALRDHPDASFAYSDNDVLRRDGRLADPFYKPDFSPERLRNHNYVLHCVMAPLAQVRAVGGFRAGFDGAQDHDLLLRLSEVGPAVHVPEVLYHWREAPASVASDPAAKPYAYEAGVRAVQEHCDRVGIAGSVAPGAADGVYRVLRTVPTDRRVSIVIPTRGTSAAVWGVERVLVSEAMRSILERSTFTDVEFVVVVDTEISQDVLADVRAIGDVVKVVTVEGPFNFSKSVNAGAGAAAGDLLLFLNDDTELIEPDSIGEMAAVLQQPDVAMVGAKLLYADGRLQHAGHVFPGLASHALLGYPGDHPGPYRMAIVARECSGVTAAAAMMRADVFREIGGFDEALPHNFNDVDLSFRMRAAGYRIVWTPHASWYHFESASRDPATGDDERDLLLARWRDRIEHDPYFNVNLAPHRTDWLERPGRSGAPPYYVDEQGKRRFS